MRKRLKGGSPATWKAAAKDLVRRAREHEVKAKEVELLERAWRAEKKPNTKVKASVPVGGAELSTQLNSTPTGDGASILGRRSAQPNEVATGGNGGARAEERVRGSTCKCWWCTCAHGQMGHLSRDCTMTEQEGRDRL